MEEPCGQRPKPCSPSPASLPQRTVQFATQATIHEFATYPPVRDTVTMAQQLYETFPKEDVSDQMITDAAKLFSEHYGTWGKRSHRPGEFPRVASRGGLFRQMLSLMLRLGTAVKMSTQRLKDEYLPEGVVSSYTRVLVNGYLAGNAFVCRWRCNDQRICWITQLVVHKDYRERGLARGLLTSLKQDTDNIFGVISSHPAACLATARSYGSMSRTLLLEGNQKLTI